MSSSQLTKTLVINAAKIQLRAEIAEKKRKKGILTKLVTVNAHRTNALVEILSSTETQASLKKKSVSHSVHPLNHSVSDNTFLKKYYEAPKGGPNHSIAPNRAHHLTKFLRQYLLNAFQSGQFPQPHIPSKFSVDRTDSNGHVRNKYSFAITDVELLADLTRLKIFWSASGDEELDLTIEQSLEAKLKNQIRIHLTSQRIMNYVPAVVFVRDYNKFMTDRLDEFLTKVKIETQTEEVQNKKDESEKPPAPAGHESQAESNLEEMKTPEIDNLYGVDFSQLMNEIKKGSDFTPWKPNTDDVQVLPTPANDTNVTVNKQLSVKKALKSNKFEVSLRTYQIQQRQKYERINRRAILMLETQKFQETL